MQINYFGYINQSGYSIAAQDYILSMLRADPELDIKLSYLSGNAIGVSKNRQQMFAAMSKHANKPNQIQLYHCIPHRYRRPKEGSKFIGICLFETMNPPKTWIDSMNEMDSIIVASGFNKRIFESSGLKKPSYLVPHAFDDALFNNKVTHKGRYRQFTFLAMGTWKHRKNWEGLIKAFYDAFEEKDETCLLIKTDKPRELDLLVKRIKRDTEWRSKNTAPIYQEEKTSMEFEDIPSFMAKGDVYISASLGEGFGLPGLHAMALGIPVITVKYGGVLEYAKDNLCTYIEPKSYKTYPVMDGIPQFSNCIWPIIKNSDIRDKMTHVYKNFSECQKKALEAYDFVHKNFNYNVIGNKMLEAIWA